MKYLCIKNGENKGVYKVEDDTEWKELCKMLKHGISSRVFNETEKTAALKWTGVKEVSNHKQEVIQEKNNLEKTSEFTKLMNLVESFNTVFVKITLTDGIELIIPMKEFCLFECLCNFINFHTINKCYNDNKYEVYMESVSIQNRNNMKNIKTMFYEKYEEIIKTYKNLQKNSWSNNRQYIIPTEIELFKQTLEIVKDSIIKNYCNFNYDFHSSIQYKEQNQFIFIKNVIKEFNITQDIHYNNHLYITYKPMIINKNEIVKIEPYIDSRIQSFIITDKDYISVLKEFKEKLKKEGK